MISVTFWVPMAEFIGPLQTRRGNKINMLYILMDLYIVIRKSDGFDSNIPVTEGSRSSVGCYCSSCDVAFLLSRQTGLLIKEKSLLFPIGVLR